MAWVDATYLNNAIGTANVSALSLTGSVLTQYELDARSEVVSVIQYAGYSAPGPTMSTAASVSNAFLRSLCAGVILQKAYAYRKGIRMSPEVADAITRASAKLDAIYQKRLPVPGLTPSTRAGYGGSQFSPTTGDDGRPAVFSRAGLRGL